MGPVVFILGTRPEVIKLAPVVRALRCGARSMESLVVATGQQPDLLAPTLSWLDLAADLELSIAPGDRAPSGLPASATHLVDRLAPVLRERAPSLVVVQGDTTSAFAGALAAAYLQCPLAHVEAGLRTGNLAAPFPEELHRRLITSIASLHFAATLGNVENLRREGVADAAIVRSGNPVVDALRAIVARADPPTPPLARALELAAGRRLIALTMHRRESFGAPMRTAFAILRRFIDDHPECELLFPVHPNPAVQEAAQAAFRGVARVQLLAPLAYPDFLQLLARSWLIVSDSGGVQEEAPTLGRPLLILRDVTERPEVVEAGAARLVGADGRGFAQALAEAAAPGSWAARVGAIENPFGDGAAAPRIAAAIRAFVSPPQMVGAAR